MTHNKVVGTNRKGDGDYDENTTHGRFQRSPPPNSIPLALLSGVNFVELSPVAIEYVGLRDHQRFSVQPVRPTGICIAIRLKGPGSYYVAYSTNTLGLEESQDIFL